MKPFDLALVAALLAGCGMALAQDPVALQPVTARISDAAIHADYKTYEAVQARIRALNERGRVQGPRVADWALAKAQCWLDVSFHEYSRNDRSAFPQEALGESVRLVGELEAGRVPPADTPLVNQALRLRADLWEAAAALRQHPGWSCAAPRAVCAEVELVHAGNEERQQGWRHAKPYVQIAEDSVGAAQFAAQSCPAVASARADAAPAPAVHAPAAASTEFGAHAAVLFDFDRSASGAIRPLTRERLDAFVARLRTPGLKLTRVTVTGYTDRLAHSRADDYNRKLSLARAQTVARLLIEGGVPADLIEVAGRAEANPVESCQGRRAGRELQDCLLPNRRVEIEALGRIEAAAR